MKDRFKEMPCVEDVKRMIKDEVRYLTKKDMDKRDEKKWCLLGIGVIVALIGIVIWVAKRRDKDLEEHYEYFDDLDDEDYDDFDDDLYDTDEDDTIEYVKINDFIKDEDIKEDQKVEEIKVTEPVKDVETKEAEVKETETKKSAGKKSKSTKKADDEIK